MSPEQIYTIGEAIARAVSLVLVPGGRHERRQDYLSLAGGGNDPAAAAQATIEQVAGEEKAKALPARLRLRLADAMLAVQERAAVTGQPEDELLHELADLAKDPETLEKILLGGHEADELSWELTKSLRGGDKAIWVGEGQRRPVYGERARRLVEGQKKRQDRDASSAAARKIGRLVLFGEGATAEHFQELATHLPSLSVQDLRDMRGYLGTRFGPNVKRRDDMILALVDYAQMMVAKGGEPPRGMEAEEEAGPEGAGEEQVQTQGAELPIQEPEVQTQAPDIEAAGQAPQEQPTAPEAKPDAAPPSGQSAGDHGQHVEAFADRMAKRVIKDSKQDPRGGRKLNDKEIEGVKQKYRQLGQRLADALQDPDQLEELVDQGALHPDNVNLRKLFEDMTGAKLPKTNKETKKVLEDHIDKLRNPQPEHAKEGPGAAVEPEQAKEETEAGDAVHPAHEEMIVSARQTDKKVAGGGRYEAEAWLKLKKRHPNAKLPKLSRNAAEYVADEYDRDNQPVPHDVLADYPDLAAKYKVEAKQGSQEQAKEEQPPVVPSSGPSDAISGVDQPVTPSSKSIFGKDYELNPEHDNEHLDSAARAMRRHGFEIQDADEPFPERIKRFAALDKALRRKVDKDQDHPIKMIAEEHKDAVDQIDGWDEHNPESSIDNDLDAMVGSSYSDYANEMASDLRAQGHDDLADAVADIIPKLGKAYRKDIRDKIEQKRNELATAYAKQEAEEEKRRGGRPKENHEMTYDELYDKIGKRYRELKDQDAKSRGKNGGKKLTSDEFNEMIDLQRQLEAAKTRTRKVKTGTAAGDDQRTSEDANESAEYTNANAEQPGKQEEPANAQTDSEAQAGANASTEAGTGTGSPDVSPDRLERQGEAGDKGGVRSGLPVGDAASAAPEGNVPGDGAGSSEEGPTGRVRNDDDSGVTGSVRGSRAGGNAPGSGAAIGDGTALSGPGKRKSANGAGGRGEGRVGGSSTGGVSITDPTPTEEVVAAEPTQVNPTDIKGTSDFSYADRDFAYAGLKQKFRWNVEALKVLRNIQAEGRDHATPAEQAILSKFIGWGQFPNVFSHQEDAEWKEEQEELKMLLGDEGFKAARSSTLNAHYTDPSIVAAHWQIAQKLGFKGGRYLEPSAGIGYYMGMMPADLKAKTRVTAIEKDDGTAGMLKLLYPQSDVRHGGFEEQSLADNYYDLVASNVPFGDYKVHDPKFNHYKANIHDYFFLKSVDKVRPGGVVMHITSTGTMDKESPAIRRKLAKDLKLVSAIRFPAGSHKAGAGTMVATDMLIFRKRLPGEEPTEDEYDWTQTTTIPDPLGGDPIPVNKYFVDHPEQVLGQIDRSGKMYGANSPSVSPAADYEDRLKAAIDRIPSGILTPAKAPTERFTPTASSPKPGQAKAGSYHIHNGKLHVATDGGLEEVSMPLTKDQLQKYQGQIGIRDAMRQTILDQLENRDATGSRKNLNDLYDAFVAKHGPLNSPANLKLFAADPEASNLQALEHYDPKTKKVTRKADIFTQDVVRPRTVPTTANNTRDALGISLHETGSVDIDRIAQATNLPKEKVMDDLYEAGLAYHDPSEGWLPADQYLSGNVRKKLAAAQAAAQNDPRYQKNVEELLKVQPADIPFADITVKMGAPWVPPSDIKQFMADALGGQPDHFEVTRDPSTGEWHVGYTSRGNDIHRHSQAANEVWGTYIGQDRKRLGYNKYRYEGEHGVHFMELMKAAMGSGLIKVTRTEYDDEGRERKVVDQTATEAANEKLSSLKEKFSDWIWQDQERRERLHRHYNDNFNNVVQMKYNGQHQVFPGLNPSFKPHAHIPDFVWQVVTRGRAVGAHEVGMGKTSGMVIAAMELRRLGLAKKPTITALKSNVETIAEEARHLYPGARILSCAGKYSKEERQKVMSQIATGDYDLIVMTHEQLDKLKMSKKTQRQFIQQELDELLEHKLRAEANSDKPKNDANVKRIEKAIENLETKLKKSLDESDKDDAIGFEETGIDHLFVDEAHHYKTLPCYTQMGTVKGISTGRSDRATEMYMRTRWLLQRNKNRGVVFMTGTPVTNTMGELYNLQRFVQPDILQSQGIKHFDDWARMFGDTVTRTEFTVAGELKPVTRFASFVNIPELKQMTGQDVDYRRVDGSDLGASIQRPKREDLPVTAPPSGLFLEYMESLRERAANVAKSRGKTDDGDNMLVICTDGKKASIDMRLVDASAPDHPESKTNKMIANILKHHKEFPDRAQLIFSDFGVNPVKSGFHLYGDIIDKLVKGGIPREKIADFSKFKNSEEKEEAMRKLRSGEMVVAIGGTKKLGTGVNVQDRIMAIHHLDVPDRPDMLEQRNGRGFRHGNMLFKTGEPLRIYNYVTEQSLDQTFWTRIGYKAKFIRQGLDTSDMKTRTMVEDEDGVLTPDTMAAIASGDSRVMKRLDLKRDVEALQRSEKRHTMEQNSLKQSVVKTQETVEKAQNDARMASTFMEQVTEGFSLKIGDKEYQDSEREVAEVSLAGHIAAAERELKARYYSPPKIVGQYRGLDIVVANEHIRGGEFAIRRYLQAKGGAQITFTDPKFKQLNMSINVVRSNARASASAAELARRNLEKLQASITDVYPKKEELERKRAEYQALEEDIKKNPLAQKKPTRKFERVDDGDVVDPYADEEWDEENPMFAADGSPGAGQRSSSGNSDGGEGDGEAKPARKGTTAKKPKPDAKSVDDMVSTIEQFNENLRAYAKDAKAGGDIYGSMDSLLADLESMSTPDLREVAKRASYGATITDKTPRKKILEIFQQSIRRSVKTVDNVRH